MKKILFSILWLVFLSTLSISGNLNIIKQNISKKPTGLSKIKSTMFITSPKQGDYFKAGDTIQIRWKAIGYIKNKCVSLYLLRNAQNVRQITPKVCINGFNWKIPINFKGGHYKIKLISENKKITAYSNIFPIIVSKPDLAVRNVYISPHTPSMGDKIKLNIEVINNGGSKANSSEAKVDIYKPDGKILRYNSTSTVKVKTLTSLGGRDLVSIPIQLDKYHHGKYTVKIKLDTKNSVNESNESNNSRTYYFTAKALPDLAVCVDVNKRPRPFKKTTIRAYVINRGDAPSKPCNLVIAVRDDTYANMHKYNFSIPALSPHQIYSSAHVRYKWHDFSNKKKYFYAVIDSNKQIKEVSEANFASGFYYLTRPGGKHGEKNKVSCSWMSPYPVDKSAVGIK